MKQLTCEMCGSTDLIKQDGVFVCQSCGIKYSVEEAKKMMVEGTVEVTGTVKIDNSEAYENYVQIANDSFQDTRFDNAYTAIFEALKIKPDDPFLLEKQALSILGRDSFNQNIPNATTNGMNRAIQMAKEKLSDSELLKFSQITKKDIIIVEHYLTNNFNAEISTLKSQKKSTRSTGEVLADFVVTPMFVAAQKDRDDNTAKQHNAKLDKEIAVIKRKFKILSAFEDQCIKSISEIKGVAEEQIAEKQADRNRVYWEENFAKKAELETKIDSLTAQRQPLQEHSSLLSSQISKLKDEMAALTPAEAEQSRLLILLNDLESQRMSLSIFRAKEKKSIQKQIEKIEANLSQVRETAKRERSEQLSVSMDRIEPLQKELGSLMEKIHSIEAEIDAANNELTRNR